MENETKYEFSELMKPEKDDESLKKTINEIATVDKQAVSKAFVQEYNSILDSIKEINNQDIICYQSCKLCNSVYRFEAEQLWETKNKNNMAVWRWLAEEKKCDIPAIEVGHHLKEHYSKQESELRLRDYSQKINNILRAGHKRVLMIDTALAICEETMGRVAIMDTRGDIRKEKLRADSLTRVLEQMSKLIELQIKIESTVNPADALKQRIVNIWRERLAKVTPETQKELIHMLELIQSHQPVTVEGKIS